MATQIFVNLPVSDLKASIAFFTRLGFTFDPKFTDACHLHDRRRPDLRHAADARQVQNLHAQTRLRRDAKHRGARLPLARRIAAWPAKPEQSGASTALEYIECIADDVKPGKLTSFPQSVKLKEGETVVFAWIVFKSRKHRDQVNAKVMKYPRIAALHDALAQLASSPAGELNRAVAVVMA